MLDKSKVTFQDLKGFTKFRISYFLKISGITLANTLIFFGLGYFLDNYFNTKPRYIIIFLISSFPILQYILYKYVRKYNQG